MSNDVAAALAAFAYVFVPMTLLERIEGRWVDSLGAIYVFSLMCAFWYGLYCFFMQVFSRSLLCFWERICA